MAKKTEVKTEKIEREYIIPLRSEWRKVPRYRRAGKAVKGIKEFIVRHMKIRDRDLNKVKVDKYLNEEIWHKGIRHPPSKIKVRAIKEGDIVRVELVDMHPSLKFKKLREERIVTKASDGKKTKKKDTKEDKSTEEEEKEGETKKEETKEKEKSGEEAGKEMEKMAAKRMKHEKIENKNQPKHHRTKTFPGQ